MDNLKRELGLEPSVEDSDVWLRVFALRETVARVREARVAAEAELLEARKSTEGLFCATVKERLGLTDEDDGVLMCAGAMWVLDPYNAQLAVLGGAEVLAGSNPYGCNQHAHSWVERCPWDNPPEGQEWEPPAPKQKKGKETKEAKGDAKGEKKGGKGNESQGEKKPKEKHEIGKAVDREEAIEHAKEILGEGGHGGFS